MEKTFTYSIVIPAYNESERITASLDKVLAHIATQGWVAEVIVVNDGSTDNTADIVRSYMRQNPIVRLLENPGNKGKGYSVRHGMLEALGDILLLTDADLSSPIYEARKLFDAIEKGGADIAIGSRWIQRETQTLRQPFYRQVSGRVFNIMLRVVLRLKQKDTQCGFKAFTRQAALSVFPPQRIERWGFDPEILFLADKFKLKTAEIPVEWANDERTKIKLTDGFRMFWEMMRVRWYSITGQYDHLKPAEATILR
ncbi:MAG TPA: dolichyl-phosphate beta-glucosyltransferase [Terriglobales bacterium]|nr:dolichyl-phosphate beta-glucosyltransferase [Terriglobales bacterium]